MSVAGSECARAFGLFVDLLLGETAAPSRAPSEPVGKTPLSFSLSLSFCLAWRTLYIVRPSVPRAYQHVRIYVRTPMCRRRSRHAATRSAVPRIVSFHLDGRSNGRESIPSSLTFGRPVAVIVDRTTDNFPFSREATLSRDLRRSRRRALPRHSRGRVSHLTSDASPPRAHFVLHDGDVYVVADFAGQCRTDLCPDCR